MAVRARSNGADMYGGGVPGGCTAPPVRTPWPAANQARRRASGGVPDLPGENRTHRSDLWEIANTFGCEPRAGIARRDDGPWWHHGWRVGNSLIQRYRALFNERRARVGGGSHCGVEGSGLGVWKASMGRVDGGGDVWREREGEGEMKSKQIMVET